MFEETTTTTKVLEVANVASSTWYKSKSPEKKDQREFNKGRPLTIVTKKTDGRVVNDSEVIDALKELRSQQEFHSAGGYQKLKHYLYRRYEFHINKKKVYRLCRDNGLLLSKKKKSPKINSPISINRIITGPLQLWELDIKYGFIHGENRFFFLMAIIDVYLRYIVGYHIGLQCLASDLALTLKMALVRMGINDESSLVIRSDNGPQMTSNHFLKFIESNKNSLMHELIPVQTPNKNAHIESFNSIIEVEFLQNQYFNFYSESYQKTSKFIKFYQEERVHSSLKYRTPAEAYSLFLQGVDLNLKEIRL